MTHLNFRVPDDGMGKWDKVKWPAQLDATMSAAEIGAALRDGRVLSWYILDEPFHRHRWGNK